MTVTLQEDLNGYVGTTDSHHWNGLPNANDGLTHTLGHNWSTMMIVVRFKIFASEGGPVPNGATITSAVLSLHKSLGPDSTFEARRLKKDWQETQVTWNVAATGVPWQTAGALGANDVHSAADGQAYVDPDVAWLDINVTSGVQAFASGTANYGWRLGWVSGTTGAKNFVSRNNATQALRPKLTITYNSDSCGSGTLRPYDAAPVNGNPIAIAGSGATVFEAEHFNCGGQGTAYNDSEPANNAGQTFRPNEGVEIIATPDGLAVNQFNVGEWMTYTVNSPGGTYQFAILASASASGGGPGAYSVEVDGTPIPGTVTVPLTSGWDDYQWVAMQTSISLPAGQHVIKLIASGTYFRTDKLRLTASPTACNSGTSRPYTGTAILVPSSGTTTIEAEHFNCGAEGQGYHDTVAGVNQGQTFRADNEVEITSAPNNGLAVNQFEVNEWLAYTINVATTGTYDIGIIASSSPSQPGGPGGYRIEIDNQDVTGTVPVTLTTDWNDYRAFMKTGVQLTAGVHVLKLVSVDSYFRVDKVQISSPVPPGGDDSCTRPGLNLCVRFEAAPDTTFTGSGCSTTCQDGACQKWKTQNIGNLLTWYALNRGCGSPSPSQGGDGDRSDDTSRLALVDGATLSGGAADGGSAVMFTTQDMDDCVHTACDGTAWERSMANISPEDTAATEGTEQWWAHSLYLPAGFVMPPDLGAANWEALLFLEFHRHAAPFPGGTQPMIPVELFRQPGTNPRTVFRVRMHGANGLGTDNRQYVYSVPGASNIGGQCIHNNPATGVWYHFVHHIKFTSNGSGFHRMWLREGTNPVKKVLDKQNVNALFPVAGGEKSYLVIGTYHDRADNMTHSTIHDRIRRGTSYEAVKHPDFPATLPSTLAPYDCAQ